VSKERRASILKEEENQIEEGKNKNRLKGAEVEGKRDVVLEHRERRAMRELKDHK
jgi:hypothetical protein